MLGRYPTPVQHLARLATARGELWIKRDDLTSESYGGNKVRKLERILPEAAARGARRILTVGAAGSHHVLATTLYGRRAGFAVAALLMPQVATEHVEENLRAAIALGLDARPVAHVAALPLALARARRRGDHFVPPGGSSATGASAYAAAAHELLAQVRDGELPEPDVIVVALGSGGTAAGLLAGLVRGGYKGTLAAVCVTSPWLAGSLTTLALAHRVQRRLLEDSPRAERKPRVSELVRCLEVDSRYLGRGYGFATLAGERATTLAAEHGLVLEPTYTAKAFAAALDRVTEGGLKRVLFWHTFSSAPLQPLLAGAPNMSELPTALRALLVRTAPTS